ncbi:amidase signature domain-containing protein [Lasiosphaeris hirsuta]|uniref:Amidase signature domain-containing protein n=1 Tax=Lasiosphaeris hirsuta TaxID=260670 RepID=A0AA40DKQ9_9PEZI|nr:amidase signature domain-containing protein [Lasiosphaeris hirsuta]
MTTTSWEARAAEKRAATLAKIRPEWRLSPDDMERARKQRDLTGPFIQSFLLADEVSIISKDSVDIVDAIKEGKLTAVQVTIAFCKTAAIAHQINNCLHEIFFDQALELAQSLDTYYADKKTTLGPLHGLPISLKDQFHVKGVDTTMGYVGWIGSNLGIKDPSQAHLVESEITRELLALGAVLYCKTSLPQTLLFGETKNNIIGQTLNPRNQNLSCGGSSGGEGALQALRGSTLGVGTDIGGSVRIPAAFNGIFALKPTPERLPYRDAANTNPGQNTYRSTVGFLSTSLAGLDLILRSALSTQPWLADPAVAPIPFRQEVVDRQLARAGADGSAQPSESPLKLGVLWNDGVVTPHPPVTRGIRMLVDAVTQAGHKTVLWDPPPQATAKRVHVAFLKADGAHDISHQLELSGEPLISDLRDTFQLRPPMDLLEYQGLTLQGLEYESAYSDYWNSTAADDGQVVDAVIMPVAPHAAVIPGRFYHTAYTEAINLLNYSAAVIPVTKADKTTDIPDPSFRPLGPEDKVNWEAYDAEIYDGGPVGLQIVARKFEEEKVLAVAKIVYAALQASKAKVGVV